jgi:hypothetical protein
VKEYTLRVMDNIFVPDNGGTIGLRQWYYEVRDSYSSIIIDGVKFKRDLTGWAGNTDWKHDKCTRNCD